ncbi:MAG TPA: hypothetical protein VG621_02950 [Candidatus Paceibacterota bacterium]|nr:hypothetical protein [Candidatus Paceibacterota bacterium]
MPIRKQEISNRVFIGCPWKVIREKYVRVVTKLEHSFPIHFVLIGRESDQRAEELLTLIKTSLSSSTVAIFDATGGNANVSLEYGFADASNIDRIIYLNVHENNHKTDRKDTAIIADLAGQRRKQYKNEASLMKLLSEFSRSHTFTHRFEAGFKKIVKNIKSRHLKKKYRTLSIKLFHLFDEKEIVRRGDLFEQLLSFDYSDSEIEFMIKGLKKVRLINVTSGRYADVSIA